MLVIASFGVSLLDLFGSSPPTAATLLRFWQPILGLNIAIRSLNVYYFRHSIAYIASQSQSCLPPKQGKCCHSCW
uniref:Putative secreted protein n=1 Tax=Anopheles darlingi TaxID=43151 RepID=A0A2M4DCT3_ANODA